MDTYVGTRGNSPGTFAWRIGTAGIALAVMAGTLAAVLLLVPDARTAQTVANASGVVVYTLVLVAAVSVYFTWQLTGDHVWAWLTAGCAMVGVQGIGLNGLLLTDHQLVEDRAAWLMLVELLVLAWLLGLARWSRSGRFRVDPAVVGIGTGAGLTGLRFGLVTLAEPFRITTGMTYLLVVLLVAVCAGLTCYLWRLQCLPRDLRTRFAAAAALLLVSHLVAYRPVSFGTATVVLVASVAGNVVLWTGAITLLHSSIRESLAARDLLHELLEASEADHRVDRARLHEVGATIAGIASASQLIHHGPLIDAERRSVLADMMVSESARLQRLMGDRTPATLGTVDLDTTISRLQVAHQARGHLVRWLPTGTLVTGRSDDVTEVLNILLDNAAKHAWSQGATVTVEEAGGLVWIAVSDSGPGIAPADRDAVFAWGSRGDTSTGHGIGLHVARQLMVDQGGSLELADSAAPGATFVITIPAAVPSTDGSVSDERLSQCAE